MKIKKGQKFLTQDGREATFIIRDDKLKRPLIFRVKDEVWTRRLDGRHCECDGTSYPAIMLEEFNFNKSDEVKKV